MLAQTFGFNFNGLSQQIFGPLGGIATQMAFADLGAHDYTRPGSTESFGGRFMSFHFILASTLFTSHVQTPLIKILRLIILPQPQVENEIIL
jgi:hypothetical protein